MSNTRAVKLAKPKKMTFKDKYTEHVGAELPTNVNPTSEGTACFPAKEDAEIISDRMRELMSMKFVQDKDIPGRKFGTDIIEVKPFTYDLDDECKQDFLRGKGLLINEHESYDKQNQKIYHGLQSEWWGSDFSDDMAFADRYSCVCGKLKGQMFEHVICPECNTEVQYSSVDLEKFGWIIIQNNPRSKDQFYVINPIYYMKLEAILGKYDATESVIDAIIKTRYKDDEGNPMVSNSNSPALEEKDLMHISAHPFIRRGLIWLKDNLKEVLDYYSKKKANKKEAFQEIYDNIDKIFTHCIPVYSSVLRMEAPGQKGEKAYKVKTNTCYRSIIRSVNKINDIINDKDSDDEMYTQEEYTTVNRFLAQVQKDLHDLYEEEYNILEGKKGYIQSKVIAGRYNFSARNIIISGNRALHSDEVEMCYSSFIELFRYELTAYYAKINNCTVAEANDAILRAQSRWDKQIYHIMLYMVKTADLYVIVNRNPSINYGSFLALRIINVKADIGDRTLTVNKRILILMGADFDGDQENIFRVFGDSIQSKVVRAMNPKYTQYIDKKNGRLNRALMPTKDEAIGFYEFNNL